MFKVFVGDWTTLRGAGIQELDLHDHGGWTPRDELMFQAYDDVLCALIESRSRGMSALLIQHGGRTSRRGKTTKRSVVRGLMRSKAATPHIIRSACVQHETVFLAALKPI
ncbi:MAG: hypothetical protein AB7L26_14460 [Hyphomonadaceae bacterium]